MSFDHIGLYDPSFDAQSSTYIIKVMSLFPKTGQKPVETDKTGKTVFLSFSRIELSDPAFDAQL